MLAFCFLVILEPPLFCLDNCLSEYERDVVNRVAQVDGYLISGERNPSIIGEAFTQDEYRHVYIYSTKTSVTFHNDMTQWHVYAYGQGVNNHEEAIEDLQKLNSGAPWSKTSLPKGACGFSFKAANFRIAREEAALMDRYFRQTHLKECSVCKILGIFSLDSHSSLFYVFYQDGDNLLSAYFDAMPEVQYRHYVNYSNENRIRLRRRIADLCQLGMLQCR